MIFSTFATFQMYIFPRGPTIVRHSAKYWDLECLKLLSDPEKKEQVFRKNNYIWHNCYFPAVVSSSLFKDRQYSDILWKSVESECLNYCQTPKKGIKHIMVKFGAKITEHSDCDTWNSQFHKPEYPLIKDHTGWFLQISWQ